MPARWLGLALPRILLRLPYGPQTDAIDEFPFDELSGDPDHEYFLWGNPAFACLLLLARAYQAGKRADRPDKLILDGLPAYVYHQEGSKTMKPCAEVLLSERTGRQIQDKGLIPLLSHRDRNAVSVMRFQTLADPPTSFDIW